MLVRWNPWKPARTGWDVGDWFSLPARPRWTNSQAYDAAVDIKEEAGRYLVRADAPGFDRQDLEVKFENGLLTLSGSRKDEREEKKDHYVYRERRAGGFYRAFRLGADVDSDKVEASYKDGVLQVVLPKKPEAKPKQITVEA